MSGKVDFSEPIPAVVDRLVREHRQLGPKLQEIRNRAEISVPSAADLLQLIKPTVLHHAVEEEARIVRVVMEHEKSNSTETVRVMQEHRWVVDFFQHKLPSLVSLEGGEAREEITRFIRDLEQHFEEEERIAFPLAMKAYGDTASPK